MILTQLNSMKLINTFNRNTIVSDLLPSKKILYPLGTCYRVTNSSSNHSMVIESQPGRVNHVPKGVLCV